MCSLKVLGAGSCYYEVEEKFPPPPAPKKHVNAANHVEGGSDPPARVLGIDVGLCK